MQSESSLTAVVEKLVKSGFEFNASDFNAFYRELGKLNLNKLQLESAMNFLVKSLAHKDKCYSLSLTKILEFAQVSEYCTVFLKKDWISLCKNTQNVVIERN